MAGERGPGGDPLVAAAAPWAGRRATASWRTSSSVRTSGSVISGCAGSGRVRLQWNRSIALWLAGYGCVRPSATPAKTNWLTNACGTATALNSLDEAQNSDSTEYPRGELEIGIFSR